MTSQKLREILDSFISRELAFITDAAPDHYKAAAHCAMFPGGGRVRPLLILEIAEAAAGRMNTAVLGAATSVELIHCASLVHDDLPCFDDAAIRRGRPSVHKQFGENTALLVGDGLIAGAFEVLARNSGYHPQFSQMVQVLSRAMGASDGLVSGQAWEDQPDVSVSTVHTRKTGALFEAATVMAALVAGVDSTEWRALGLAIGNAYQAADDLLDAAGSEKEAGKPVLQDARKKVASTVNSFGLAEALSRFNRLVDLATQAVPECPGRERLAQMVRGTAMRLCPPGLTRLEKKSPHLQQTTEDSTVSYIAI